MELNSRQRLLVSRVNSMTCSEVAHFLQIEEDDVLDALLALGANVKYSRLLSYKTRKEIAEAFKGMSRTKVIKKFGVTRGVVVACCREFGAYKHSARQNSTRHTKQK